MSTRRMKRYSRRMHSHSPKSRAPIILAAVAFLLLSAVISVLIGISLGKRAQEPEDGVRFDFAREDYISNGKKVGGVEAYYFAKTSDAASYISQKIYDFSVCLRHEDGTLDYYLETAEKFGFDRMNDPRKLDTLCDSAHKHGGRVCAYMYISSFDIEDAYMREIMKAYELSLIKDVSDAGVDDILLLGISVTEENIAEVESFVAKAAKTAVNAPLGICVGEALLDLNDEETYLAARLRKSCDYLALDLTHLTVSDGESVESESGEKIPCRLEEILRKNEFYIKSYPMRIVFSREESKLYIPALRLGVTDLQIVVK